MKIFLKIAIFVFFSLALSPISRRVEARADSPSVGCEIYQKSWCIISGDATVEFIPDPEEGYSGLWILRGATWRNFPLRIYSTSSCRESVGRHFSYAIDGERDKMWREILIKIEGDGNCYLRLYYPNQNIDKQLGAGFYSLGKIRLCQDSSCRGVLLGEIVDRKNFP